MRSEEAPRSPAVWLMLGAVMLAAGMAIPLQGRINAELAVETGDAVFAAFLSFFSGTLALIPIGLATRRTRASFGKIIPALRAGTVKWWYFLAGCLGGYFVLTQTLTIAALGVAVFSVAAVTGQTLGGLVWDRVGLGPAGRRHLDGFRVLGAAMTVLAVLWAVWPQFDASPGVTEALLLVVLPLTAGFVQAAQQALNGRQSAAYGTPIPGTVINFIAGSVMLFLVWLATGVVTGLDAGLSPVWWHYLGGPMGIMFIALGAFLVTRVGVLLAAMGMIAGQLVGSLLLDIIVPAPGAVVTFATVAGTLLTILAVVVASFADIRRSGGSSPR
ncbi:DMT family transporter [Nesterenkonia alba]|uniref:DMT family transporter n=1 Tax=Nesterenkonia alba TaxID=515814 RepID=UPI00041558A4|nr:DMT family transporter [Nesterenkonia alba]